LMPSNKSRHEKSVVDAVHTQRNIAIKIPFLSFDVLLSKLKMYTQNSFVKP
jgi:hypothetical protein